MTFQSTPPCGGDPAVLAAVAALLISIHAPLRGRPGFHLPDTAPIHFNPRPLAGATVCSAFLNAINSNFNPRPLAGATVGIRPGDRAPRDFNPRPLAGATQAFLCFIGFQSISIHAPLRGRLVQDATVSAFSAISIHAPLRGRR